jgi:hypothetical protein
MPARDMAAYMRKRRARQKAERKAAERGQPVIDKALSRSAILKASEGELAAVRRKAAAIGRGAVITKTGERLDVLSRDAFEARHRPPAPPSPRSTFAIGGRPGPGLVPQGPGMPLPPDLAAVSQYTRFQENTVAMLAALAARVDAQEREIAALKAADADRKANAHHFAGALFNLMRAAIGG